MEQLSELEQKRLMEELKQGKESAKQLKNQISPKTSKETCEHLVQKIVSSYDKALEFLKCTMLVKQDNSEVVGLVESSPECSNGVGSKRGRAKDQCIKGVSKKRDTLVRWTERVRVTSEIGLEGALDDGYSWRKYGQKDILGATHPRAYYRCTHRHTRGCMATKQVQKSDEDSSMVEVTYNGNHTCLDTSICGSSLMGMANKKPEDMIKQQLEVKQIKDEQDEKYEIFKYGQPFTADNEHCPSYLAMQSENQSILEKLKEDIILGSCSPGFQSSLASESNYLTTSPCEMDLYSIESDLLCCLDTEYSRESSFAI